MSKLVSLLLSLVAAYSAALIGSFFTLGAIDSWYNTLEKPFLSPPNWIFGPVWTVLYALMAVAAWLVYLQRPRSPQKNKALVVYGAHLVVNALWSIVFFGLHAPLLAFGVIVVLYLLILYTTYLFYQTRRISGLLFMPYILWVSFASYLNLMIILLN